MKRILLLTIFAISSLSLSAQLELDGLWEGTLTFGQSMKGHHMALILEKHGKKVSGKAYIHVTADRIIETEVKGRIYEDFSIYLDEIQFVNTKEEDPIPPYLRKFQLLWNRSIGGSSIKGYWQERRDETFHKNRKRGMLFLSRAVEHKA